MLLLLLLQGTSVRCGCWQKGTWCSLDEHKLCVCCGKVYQGGRDMAETLHFVNMPPAYPPVTGCGSLTRRPHFVPTPACVPQASREPPGPLLGLAQGQGWGAGAAQGERRWGTGPGQGPDEGLTGVQTPIWGTWSFRKVWTRGMWRRRGCWKLPCLAFSMKDPCLTSAAGVGQGCKARR